LGYRITLAVFLLLFLGFIIPGYAQMTAGKKWKILFDQPFDRQHTATEALWDSIKILPSPIIRQFISGLEADKSVSGNETGQGKLALLKMRYSQHTNSDYPGTSWRELGAEVLRLSTITQNMYLLQTGCDLLGDLYLRHDRSDTAIFYLLKSCALAEQLGYKEEMLANDKIAASNVLYRTQNYAQCILFCSNSINIEEALTPIAVVTAYNNTGLGYLKLGNPDSALFYFTRAANFSRKKSWGIWEGIAAGNIGDALHAKGLDAEAVPYWQKDYDSSIKYGQWGNAGLTLAY
jgi:tetratricopeptide (TPR) repeat protein